MAASHAALATKADLLAIKGDIHALEGRLSRWVLTCILGQTAVLAGWVYFILVRTGGR